jgi:hypothetical protein
MGEIVKLAVVSGLRPGECIESVRLLSVRSEETKKYYNEGRQALEHFRFPELF